MKVKITPKHLEILKQLSNEVWATYSDEFGYRTEKQKLNSSVGTDHPDNIWFFWNQFDAKNHEKLFDKLWLYPACPERIDLLSFVLLEMKREQEAISRFKTDL